MAFWFENDFSLCFSVFPTFINLNNIYDFNNLEREGYRKYLVNMIKICSWDSRLTSFGVKFGIYPKFDNTV